VGLVGTVSTLKTGYPRIQALSQDKEHGVHPRAATYIVALDHTSLQRWSPVPPCVSQSWTSRPCWGELRRCHMSLSSRLHFPVEVGFGASTCLMPPGSASPRGELRCCHVFHIPSGLWTTGIKKGLAVLGSHVSKTHSCVIEAQCSVGPADHYWT
jgi:hypothetical protein